MRLFRCAGCEAKEQTIAILKEQLAAAERRAEATGASIDKALEGALAMADKQAHAAAYRKPGVERPKKEPGLSDPYSAMALVATPMGKPKTQEELEELIDAASGRIPVVGEQPRKPEES